MLSLLLACGLRRSEVVNLRCERIQRREDRWAIVDLVGKSGHIRTVPIPQWVKNAIDDWTKAANIKEGLLFRWVIWGYGLTNQRHLVRRQRVRDKSRDREACAS
jgi:integrase